MDLVLILTIVATGAAVISVNVGLMAWLRSDIKTFEGEIRGWKEEIYKEMKDFHGRLCSLEGRKKTDP